MAGIDYWEEEASFKGLAMPVAQLLIDGWATGDDAVIAALDRYAYESCDRFINETLLHLRRVYKKQVFRGSPTSDNNRPGGSSSDESVLQDFRRKSPAAQNEILMKSIGMLLYETDMYGNSLFEKKQDWIAIYLVVKSRLKIRVTQKNSTCTVEKLLSTCHPIVNSMLCHPSVQFSVDYSNGNNSKRPTPIF